MKSELFTHQYELVQSSRNVVLDFCESFREGDYTRGLTFDDKSICNLHVHTANTYQGWIMTIARKLQVERYKDSDYQSIHAVKELFQQVDDMVFTFIQDSSDTWLETLEAEIRGKKYNLTRAQIFTHVMTHEFHHKGQILMLARQMGYSPPDTDIIRI
jgi:uncharacterized damage-inducible protein DinB